MAHTNYSTYTRNNCALSLLVQPRENIGKWPSWIDFRPAELCSHSSSTCGPCSQLALHAAVPMLHLWSPLHACQAQLPPALNHPKDWFETLSKPCQFPLLGAPLHLLPYVSIFSAQGPHHNRKIAPTVLILCTLCLIHHSISHLVEHLTK